MHSEFTLYKNVRVVQIGLHRPSCGKIRQVDSAPTGQYGNQRPRDVCGCLLAAGGGDKLPGIMVNLTRKNRMAILFFENLLLILSQECQSWTQRNPWVSKCDILCGILELSRAVCVHEWSHTSTW